MKKVLVVFLLFLILQSCSSDNDTVATPVSISFQFSHVWDTSDVDDDDLNQIKFTNEHGEQLSIERLRYLISDVTLTHQSGAIIELDDYQLIDLGDGNSYTFVTSEAILPGNYTQVTFRFGFKNEDNVDGIYQDLNTANFNVPAQLGGGYHFMQFDGKYLDNNNAEAAFNYHTIRAVDISNPNSPVFNDTSIRFGLGDVIVGGNTRILIQMDISEWFKNPNTWDLNTLNTVLMPNFDAQISMSQNGTSVFSLLDILQD